MPNNQSGGSHQSGGSEHGGSGNFADDPQRASEAAKKKGRRRRSQLGTLGLHSGSEKSAQHSSETEAARKGGQHSHGGRSK